MDGVDVYVGGFGGQAYDFISSFGESHVTLLLMTFGVVILILLFTYRSPVLWILPILCAFVANTMAGGVVYLMAKYAGMVVNDQSQYILSILVIGAGTDYALLLVARYREELRRHEDRHEAMAFALHRAAPAIIASAATVVVGLLCLAFADLNSTASLGPVLAVGVAVTLLVMVTLLPALLVIFGRWIFWPCSPPFGTAEPTQKGLWARVGQPDLAAPAHGMGRHGGRPAGRLPRPVQARRERPLHRGLVHRGAQLGHGPEAAGEPRPGRQLQHDPGRGQRRPAPGHAGRDRGHRRPRRHAHRPTSLGDGRSYYEVPIKDDLASDAAFQIVEDARDAVHAVDGADALVGGGAAFYLDTKTASIRDNKVVIPLVLIVVLLILIVLLRALTAPLILVGTVILSFGAALGLSALIFDYVFDFAGADAGFPLFAFVFLVALGIDYNIFLMTRVREETAQHGTRKGSLIALSSTGGVITSAGWCWRRRSWSSPRCRSCSSASSARRSRSASCSTP